MVKYCYRWQSKFQSTLSMRRATETPAALQLDHVISIHALHEESDMSDNVNHPKHYEFQSTLSMRRATETRATLCSAQTDFNPRSP